VKECHGWELLWREVNIGDGGEVEMAMRLKASWESWYLRPTPEHNIRRKKVVNLKGITIYGNW
jgi:hypothetical protein